MTRTLAAGRAATVTVPRTWSAEGSGAEECAGAAAATSAAAMAMIRNRRINLLRQVRRENPLSERAPQPPHFPEPMLPGEYARGIVHPSADEVFPVTNPCHPEPSEGPGRSARHARAFSRVRGAREAGSSLR